MSKFGLICLVFTVVVIHVLVLFLVLNPANYEELADKKENRKMSSVRPSSGFSEKTGSVADEVPESKAVKRPVVIGSTVKNNVPSQSAAPVSGTVPVPQTVPAPKTVPAAAAPQTSSASATEKFSFLNPPAKIFNAARFRSYSGVGFTGKIPKLPKLSAASQKNMTGILVDLKAREILWQKNPSKPVPVASLTKMMTLLVAYEKVMNPRSGFTLMSEISVTNEARSVPPSGVAFRADETSFPLHKLMLAAAVKSANDAAFLIAQAMGGGDCASFVEQMNTRAKELGMTDTVFYNPHGLTDYQKGGKKRNNMSTANDLLRLCEAYSYYPQLLKWSAMPVATFRSNADLVNHNNLLPGRRTACKGVTGIKTGFTNSAGFCVAAACTRDGRQLLAVVTGFTSARERDEFVRSLLNWAYSSRK